MKKLKVEKNYPRLFKKAIYTFLLILIMSISISKSNELSVGLGYPYIGVKYGNEKIAGEIKGAFGSEIQLYAGRFYMNFLEVSRVRLFMGLEAGYINFSDLYDISGKGWELGIFAGVETFVMEWFSVSLDFAPTYINVKSGGDSDGGVEYIVNFAINIFPFKSKRKVFKQESLTEENKTKQVVMPTQNKEPAQKPTISEDKNLSVIETEKDKQSQSLPKEIDGITLTEDIL